MPSDEMVEKALAAFTRTEGKYTDRMRAAISAALAAAEAGEPVAWRWRYTEGSEPNQRWRLVEVLPVLDAVGVEVQPLYASPPSEASRDERAAIRKEAFEEAAKVADDHAEAWGAAMASPAIVIATAIRARGET